MEYEHLDSKQELKPIKRNQLILIIGCSPTFIISIVSLIFSIYLNNVKLEDVNMKPIESKLDSIKNKLIEQEREVSNNSSKTFEFPLF